MSEAVFLKIKKLLDSKHMLYTVMDHEPTPTSADAARVRGTKPEEGAKAMVLRSKGTFLMCVLPGDEKIDLNKMRIIINNKSLSFATPEQVKEITDCDIGSVPPFGNLFDIPIYVDKYLLRNEHIAFNAGLVTRSITMNKEDYLNIIHAHIEDFIQ